MRSSFALGILALAPLLGCTGTVSGSPGGSDADVAATTSAVVVVERTVDATEGLRAETSARFVRVAARAATQDDLRTIGAALDLPAPGTCASLVALAGAAPPAALAPVIELSDVGAVSIEAGGVATRLLPRQLPDVTDVVSGVVYARALEPTLFPAATRYVLHVGRSGALADLEPFDVTTTAPSDPADVHVIGEDAAGGLTVAAGAPIDLAWTGDGAHDVLYVDLQPAGFRCDLGASAAEDHGHASVPASLVDDAGTIAIHRVHRETFHARGLESGEIRFDFARSVPYVRR